MQFLVSVVIGITGLYALAVGAWHLAYGSWFPFFPAPVANLYNMLQAGFGGASFKTMAIVLLIFGGLVSFFAFLLYPQQKAG
ncbi:MAG: hypothetical protein KIT13_11850 [Burkholderiales bacterium]|nr:hypothetical protein [Burkholderiales bacterium]MCW5576778.1 hypothetical protein [Burkholderiales bacterium]